MRFENTTIDADTLDAALADTLPERRDVVFVFDVDTSAPSDRLERFSIAGDTGHDFCFEGVELGSVRSSAPFIGGERRQQNADLFQSRSGWYVLWLETNFPNRSESKSVYEAHRFDSLGSLYHWVSEGGDGGDLETDADLADMLIGECGFVMLDSHGLVPTI